LTAGVEELYDTIREDFVEYFEDVEEYCMSAECNHVNNKYNLHAYFKFYDLTDCVTVGSYVPPFCESTVDVQPSKRRRNVLLYISKADMHRKVVSVGPVVRQTDRFYACNMGI
jgi:hypothetical protein